MVIPGENFEEVLKTGWNVYEDIKWKRGQKKAKLKNESVWNTLSWIKETACYWIVPLSRHQSKMIVPQWWH